MVLIDMDRAGSAHVRMHVKMFVCAGPDAAEWVECGWDVPAAAVAHRTLVGVHLCCATDAEDCSGVSPVPRSGANCIDFCGDLGEHLFPLGRRQEA